MNDTVLQFAASLGHAHSDLPRLIFDIGTNPSQSNRWRAALRHVGVPVLELSNAPAAPDGEWLQVATDFSREFMLPVVVFGAGPLTGYDELLADMGVSIPASRQVDDPAWLHTRQVAVTGAVETSVLNREFRRNRDRKGWIRIGWQPEAALAEGNGLLLAWSSPLPLRRIRDFAARCPELTLVAADAEAIAQEVGAQGISVKGWRFAVK